MKTRLNLKDFLTSLMFILSGAGAMFFSAAYKLGKAADMGPGYFPFALGAILVLIGIALGLKSIMAAPGTHSSISIRVKPVMMILLSVLVFGFSLEHLGLLTSVVLLVILSSLAGDEFRLKEVLVNTLVLTLAVYVIFVYFLEFRLPLLPWFIS